MLAFLPPEQRRYRVRDGVSVRARLIRRTEQRRHLARECVRYLLVGEHAGDAINEAAFVLAGKPEGAHLAPLLFQECGADAWARRRRHLVVVPTGAVLIFLKEEAALAEGCRQ